MWRLLHCGIIKLNSINYTRYFYIFSSKTIKPSYLTFSTFNIYQKRNCLDYLSKNMSETSIKKRNMKETKNVEVEEEAELSSQISKSKNNNRKRTPKKKSAQKESSNVANDDAPAQSGNKDHAKNSHGNRNRSWNKGLPEIQFEPYITMEKCLEGLRSKDLIEGVLRINPKKFDDAYISSDDNGERDILIEGVVSRNRALEGDCVAIKLKSSDEWKTLNDGVQKTGKVVFITEKKHSRAATGQLKIYKNNAFGFALLSPIDARLPRMMIPLTECPDDFKCRPDDYQKTLFIAHITNWGLTMPFAAGKLVRSLGERGQIEPETEGILFENNIDSSDFKEDVLKCLPDGETWTISPEELSKRVDLREECIFTIDPASARDLDDALSCKEIGDKLFEVGVHIADVSHFIDQGIALDKVAKSRATSVYLAQKVIPMLPRVLCEQLCSLNPGVDRLAYSVIWKLKSDGTIVSEWFGRSVIRSCVKLSYEHAQQMIEQEKTINPDEYPPIDGKFEINKISETVKFLFGISKHLRKRRFDSGALRIDLPKLAFNLHSETGAPNALRIYEYKDSNRLIEEFMLLANMAVGRKIYKAHPKRAILRNHPPPDECMMRDVLDICQQHNIDFDVADSASINKSLRKMSEAEGQEHIYAAVTNLCAKPFQPARYFCTGKVEEDLYRHYALNVPIYTHFTSPIRRYPDVLVHRFLTAALDKGFIVHGKPEELQVVAAHCNDKKWAAKKASEQSSKLFFTNYLMECGPINEQGVVIAVLDHSVDVYCIKLGLVMRVYCDTLSLAKHEYETQDLIPKLSLYWEDRTKNENLDDKLAALTKKFEKKWASQNGASDSVDTELPEDVIKQTLTVFTRVELVLSVSRNTPTKIKTLLKSPFDNAIPELGL